MEDEFRILVGRIPVHNRKITVRRLGTGTEADVTLPLGWWWAELPKTAVISKKQATAKALQMEKSGQSDISKMKVHSVETVLLPDGPPRRVAHQVEVSSTRSPRITYLVDAHDGSIVTSYETDKELREFFDLSPEVFNRVVAEKNGLTVRELEQIKKLLEHLLDAEEIELWLHASNRMFDGKTPIDTIIEGKVHQVLQLLIHLEEGIPY